jgi:tRNA1(Val) A37 N6-methylase TrmN6
MAPDEMREWIGAAARLLLDRGILVLIHRPEGLATMLGALTPAFGNVGLRPVHAKADENAIRVLVTARRGGRGPLRLLPTIVLHEADGRFTPSAQSLHHGEACLAMM